MILYIHCKYVVIKYVQRTYNLHTYTLYIHVHVHVHVSAVVVIVYCIVRGTKIHCTYMYVTIIFILEYTLNLYNHVCAPMLHVQILHCT